MILMRDPTPAMKAEANKSGTYTWPINKKAYPQVQIITVKELLDGKRPNMPTPFLPYIKAQPPRGRQSSF